MTNIPKFIHQIFFNIGKGELKQIPRFYQSHLKTKQFCQQHGIEYILWSRDDIDYLLTDIDNIENKKNKKNKKMPNFTEFYQQMKYDIQRIDFAKYLILYFWGGIYLDLDIHIIGSGTRASSKIKEIQKLFLGTPGKTLTDKPTVSSSSGSLACDTKCRSSQKEVSYYYLFVRWNDSSLPYNAILGSSQCSPLFLDIIRSCRQDYYQKLQVKVYQTWRGRFVFQTTGHYMLKRVLDRWGITSEKFRNILHIISKGKEIIAPKPLFLDTNESVWYS